MQNHRRTPPASLPAFTPVPRRHTRQDGWTAQRQRDFIAALADTGSVKHACARIGMASEGAYQLRRAKGAEEFAAAWLAALDHGTRQLEDIALERAIHGVETPVYSYGKLIGTRTVYNDRLIMFMLRNRATDRFIPGATRVSDGLRAKIADEIRAELWQVKEREGKEGMERLRLELERIRERYLAQETEEQAAWRESPERQLALVNSLLKKCEPEDESLYE